MDPGKTQNLEASLKVQSGPKTGRQLESLVQGVAGHISYSPNLKVYHSEHQEQLKTLYRNHGTKEIWAPDDTHTRPHPHPPCYLLAPFLTLATRCLFSGRSDADQHGHRDQQVLTLESSSNQIDKCCKREHVWVAGGRNGANRIIPSTSKVRSQQ